MRDAGTWADPDANYTQGDFLSMDLSQLETPKDYNGHFDDTSTEGMVMFHKRSSDHQLQQRTLVSWLP